LILGVGEFIPFGAPRSPVPRLDARALAELTESPARGDTSDPALVDMLRRSFGVTLLEALKSQSASRRALSQARPPEASSDRHDPSSRVAALPQARPEHAQTTDERGAAERTNIALRRLPAEAEEATIKDVAARAAIDPVLLHALRRAENGGPGREFGVLSVPAPTYHDQARIAAESIRRSVERFEAGGRRAFDPLSGRYTREFIEFFSRRYAPVGAGNDPANLNQYHAQNLIRLYTQLAPKV
jgi:hypothetical protein